MQVACNLWNADLASLGVTQLLLLATLQNQTWAVKELLTRYYGWSRSFIEQLGLRIGLQHADIENALHECMIRMQKALPAFDSLRRSVTTLDSVHAFLRTSLRRGFFNFVRSELRAVPHRASSRAEEPGTSCRALGSVSLHLPADVPDRREENPASLAERADTIARVQIALVQLEKTKREICEAIADGIALREMPGKLHLSRSTVRRRRDEAFSEIRHLLPEFCVS